IVVYVLGVSTLAEPQTTGAGAPLDHFVTFRAALTLNVGGIALVPTFAGLTPGSVGLMQVNFRVPSLAPGNYDLKLTVNGSAANVPKLIIGKCPAVARYFSAACCRFDGSIKRSRSAIAL